MGTIKYLYNKPMIIPIKQPGFHGKYPMVFFVAQMIQKGAAKQCSLELVI